MDDLTGYQRFELPSVIAEHTDKRNDTLYRYGCSLQAKGLDDAEVERAMRDANATRCSPPLGESELAALVDHVTRDYPKGHSAGFEAALAERRAQTEPATPRAPAEQWGDRTLSRLFAERHRSRLRYVVEAKAWYAYDGTRWAENDTAAESQMDDFIDGLAEYAAMLPPGTDATAKAQKAVASYLNNYPKRRNLLADARSDMQAHANEFDRDLGLLNVRNGTFDLSRMEFRQHDPADMITKVAGCDYDPWAFPEEFMALLEAAFETPDGTDREAITFLQRAMGAALIGDTSWERLYMLVSENRTGKSTVLETVLAVFGDYGTSMEYKTLATDRRAGGASQDLARLEGVRLVTCPEPKEGMRLDVALVKQLTGGDTITARRLYQNERTFLPCFTLFVNSNNLPRVDDLTLFEGDRVVIVPFGTHIPQDQRDRDLKRRLREPESLSGVLNWLIVGCGMRREMGYELPAACAAAVESYRSDSDAVGEFVAERCDMDPDAKTQGKALYAAWRDWCESNGLRWGTAKDLYADLARREGVTHHTRERIGGEYRRHVFEGIRLRQAET